MSMNDLQSVIENRDGPPIILASFPFLLYTVRYGMLGLRLRWRSTSHDIASFSSVPTFMLSLSRTRSLLLNRMSD